NFKSGLCCEPAMFAAEHQWDPFPLPSFAAGRRSLEKTPFPIFTTFSSSDQRGYDRFSKGGGSPGRVLYVSRAITCDERRLLFFHLWSPESWHTPYCNFRKLGTESITRGGCVWSH